MKSINVILTTIGRPSLERMLDSLVNQLREQDYLTVISDDHPDFHTFDYNEIPFEHCFDYVSAALCSRDWKCNIIHIHNSKPLGYWGHGSRNKYQNILPGDYLMNADDDDRYTDGAFEHIHEVLEHFSTENGLLYLYKHENMGCFAWWDKRAEIKEGSIGTSCGVIKNTRNLPDWELRYGGDGAFYEKLVKQIAPEKPVFVDFVIYKVGNTI